MPEQLVRLFGGRLTVVPRDGDVQVGRQEHRPHAASLASTCRATVMAFAPCASPPRASLPVRALVARVERTYAVGGPSPSITRATSRSWIGGRSAPRGRRRAARRRLDSRARLETRDVAARHRSGPRRARVGRFEARATPAADRSRPPPAWPGPVPRAISRGRPPSNVTSDTSGTSASASRSCAARPRSW